MPQAQKATDKTCTKSEALHLVGAFLHTAKETHQIISDNLSQIPFGDPLEEDFPSYAVQTCFGAYQPTPDGWVYFVPHDGCKSQLQFTCGSYETAAIACRFLNNLFLNSSL
jgi:hypothetical protein